MPRVFTRKKAARGKPYTCSTCGQAIEPGEEFYFWTFRYGGTRRIHKAHGYPRQSQLTQSQMGEVYAAVENVEDVLSGDFVIDDVTSAVEELQGVCDEVIQAYEEAAEHFNGQGPSAERAEELQSFRDELDNIDLSEWEDAANREAEGESKTCEECSGNGRVTCDNCGGGGEVSSGVLKPILVNGKPDHIEEMVECDVCAGTGDVECPECKGTGEVEPDDDKDWRENVKEHVESLIGGAP